MVHLDLIVETLGDDVALGDRPEVDPVVRHHHTKGFLDPQVECTVHTPGNMPAQGAEATHHGALGLRLALLHALERLKGRGPQLLQLLLGRVVGRLERLGLGRRRPKSRPQAWKQKYRLSWEQISTNFASKRKLGRTTHPRPASSPTQGWRA
jgi:hypothetical protein